MSELHPVSKQRHQHKRWKRHVDYQFASNDAISPLVMQELPKAIMAMPVGFLKIEDNFALVAVQGIDSGKNLYVSTDGRWLARYIPEGYRCHPFVLANNENGQQILCVNESVDFITESDVDEPFFDSTGEPSRAVSEILNFLETNAANRRATQIACKLLNNHNLIAPWPIKLETQQGEISINGLHRIDEEAFNKLGSDVLSTLHKEGLLPLIYCQLLSMVHLNALGKLFLAHNSTSKQVDSIQLDPINDSENLNFDNF